MLWHNLIIKFVMVTPQISSDIALGPHMDGTWNTAPFNNPRVFLIIVRTIMRKVLNQIFIKKMSVVDKPKGRMRSASSPAKSFKSGIFAPAADSLPLLAPDTSDHGDQSVESFAQGLDRLNSEYKKSMLVCPFFLIFSLNFL